MSHTELIGFLGQDIWNQLHGEEFLINSRIEEDAYNLAAYTPRITNFLEITVNDCLKSFQKIENKLTKLPDFAPKDFVPENEKEMYFLFKRCYLIFMAPNAFPELSLQEEINILIEKFHELNSAKYDANVVRCLNNNILKSKSVSEVVKDYISANDLEVERIFANLDISFKEGPFLKDIEQFIELNPSKEYERGPNDTKINKFLEKTLNSCLKTCKIIENRMTSEPDLVSEAEKELSSLFQRCYLIFNAHNAFPGLNLIENIKLLIEKFRELNAAAYDLNVAIYLGGEITAHLPPNVIVENYISAHAKEVISVFSLLPISSTEETMTSLNFSAESIEDDGDEEPLTQLKRKIYNPPEPLNIVLGENDPIIKEPIDNILKEPLKIGSTAHGNLKGPMTQYLPQSLSFVSYEEKIYDPKNLTKEPNKNSPIEFVKKNITKLLKKASSAEKLEKALHRAGSSFLKAITFSR